MNLTNILWLLPSIICVSLATDVVKKRESKPQQYIVSGTEAVIGQFPYFVSFQKIVSRQHYCAGSIISTWTVLTAAHCVCKDPEPTITMVAGIINLKLANQGQFLYAHRYFQYPHYNPNNFDGDIALVQLRYPVWDSPTVKSISLMNNEPDADMKIMDEATAVGFGSTDSKLQNVDNLQFVNVPLWDRSKCNTNNFALVKDSMLCGGALDGQRSTCPGDSGGPIVMNNKLIGVVSWGFGCGEPGKPSVYAYVGYYRDWIKRVSGI